VQFEQQRLGHALQVALPHRPSPLSCTGHYS
jgi:hypothetical protein